MTALMCVGESGNADEETGVIALDVDETDTGDATTNAKPSIPRHGDNSSSVQLQKGAIKTGAGPGVRHFKKRRFNKTVNYSRVIILKVVALPLISVISATYRREKGFSPHKAYPGVMMSASSLVLLSLR